MASLDYLEVSSTLDALREMRPKVEAILRRYQVPPRLAGGLLEQIAFELVYKGERIDDPGLWVVRAVRRKCLQLRKKQQRRLSRRLEDLSRGSRSSSQMAATRITSDAALTRTEPPEGARDAQDLP